MKKENERYFSPNEVKDLYKKFISLPFINTCDYILKREVPNLSKLNTSYKELAKTFYTFYFDQDFTVIQKSPNEEPTIMDVFDMPVSISEYSHIDMNQYYLDDTPTLVTFDKIYVDGNNDIYTAIKYVHELAHALSERNKTTENIFDREIIPILVELVFAYDIDSDLENYVQGEDGLMYNKYNPSSTFNGEDFNYATVKEVLKLRINSIYSFEAFYEESETKEDLVTYPLYINSTIEALLLFNSYLEGNDLILGEIDDLLRGTKRIKRTKKVN